MHHSRCSSGARAFRKRKGGKHTRGNRARRQENHRKGAGIAGAHWIQLHSILYQRKSINKAHGPKCKLTQFIKTHQYWAYEYCHNQYVRQFHVERSHDGKVEKEQETASFFLGLYPGLSKESLIHADKKAVAATTKKDHANVKTELKKNGDQRYLVQKWGDGSRCDLTEKPRTIEVQVSCSVAKSLQAHTDSIRLQYHCDLQGQDRVSSFVELSTCNYQIIISTPRLCEEMNLSHRHHIEPHKIKCRPVVSDQLIEQEQQERERKSQVNSNENQPLAAAEAEAEYQPQANEKEEQASDQELPRTDKALLGMISDLTEQINQLKLQMNAMPADTNNIRPDFSFFTLDDQGNVIPGADLAKLFGTAKQQQQQQPLQKQAVTANTEKKRPAKDQHENKQAYQQKYIAA